MTRPDAIIGFVGRALLVCAGVVLGMAVVAGAGAFGRRAHRGQSAEPATPGQATPEQAMPDPAAPDERSPDVAPSSPSSRLRGRIAPDLRV